MTQLKGRAFSETGGASEVERLEVRMCLKGTEEPPEVPPEVTP